MPCTHKVDQTGGYGGEKEKWVGGMQVAVVGWYGGLMRLQLPSMLDGRIVCWEVVGSFEREN
jgi:hypothetical protein